MLDEPTYTTIPYEVTSRTNAILWARMRSWFVYLALVAVDYAAVVLATCTAYFIRGNLLLSHQEFSIPEVYRFIVIPLGFIFFLHFDRLSIRKLYFWQQAERMFKASSYAMLLVLVVLYFTGSVHAISRIFMALTWIFSFTYLAVGRYILKRIVTAVGILQVPTIIVGAGKTAELLVEAFQQNMGAGYKIVGLIDDDPQPSEILHKYPIIGNFAQAQDAVRRAGVRNVLIAAPGLAREELLKLLYSLQPHVDHITFVPDLFGVPVGGMELETLFNEKTVLLKVKNNLATIGNRILKYILDCSVGSIVSIGVLPVLAMIAILIKLDSPGDAFYLAKRLGKNGDEFMCYKFRTMYNNSDELLQEYFRTHVDAEKEWEVFAKIKNEDPRVTNVGKWLRKYSLDELPQIFNVLKGDMSLVGPRPYLLSEEERMGYYKNTILMTMPGITGLWQVSGRNEISFDGRLNLDCWYVRNWSIWMDLVILMKTIKVVLARKGAY